VLGVNFGLVDDWQESGDTTWASFASLPGFRRVNLATLCGEPA
jgi:hypothetical protein